MPEALFQISEPGSSEKEACKGRAVGIDLGTTNSLVAYVNAGQPVCIPDEAGRTLLPSVVHYGEQVIVGREAQLLAAQFPRDTISSVKRFMGRSAKEAEALHKVVPYEFGGDAVVRFKVQGREVTPIEVSAEILKVLAERAKRELGGELDGVVITVPAYFDDAQRQATKDAGRLAGLEVLRLLNEPTAAALAYGLDKQSQGTFAVFDLGGGTFDISILKLEDGVFEVKSTGGDTALGGDDFDRAILQLVQREMGNEDRRLVRPILDAARAARERLTNESKTEIVIDRYRRTITRDELEKLIAPTIERTRQPCVQALKDAGLLTDGKTHDLDGVILVGGATRTPAVRAFVKAIFGLEPLGDINPDEVVALGAAVQADLLAGAGRDDVLLLDVIPLSLGLEMMGGVVEKLIPRNTTIPCGAKQVFTTFADKQTGFDLHVVQGERELATQNRSLARFYLKGLPPAPAGMVRAEVTFLVDADGILRVMAKELATGKEASIEVKPSYGLAEDEIERMLRESYEHADEDVKARLLVEQRVEADRILAALSGALAADGDLLENGEREQIDAAKKTLEQLKVGLDHNAIRQAIEALDHTSAEFAKRRMDRAFARDMAGKRLDEVERKL
jgi:molecular chaperone HscA